MSIVCVFLFHMCLYVYMREYVIAIYSNLCYDLLIVLTLFLFKIFYFIYINVAI